MQAVKCSILKIGIINQMIPGLNTTMVRNDITNTFKSEIGLGYIIISNEIFYIQRTKAKIELAGCSSTVLYTCLCVSFPVYLCVCDNLV